MSASNVTLGAGTNTTAPQNGTSGGHGGGGGGHGSGSLSAISDELENDRLGNFLLVVCGSIAIAMIMWRLTTALVRYIRTVTSLANDRQQYFAEPMKKMSFFKKHVLYAPILRKRHNREIQLSSALNIGTLPTRLQFAFIVGYVATNVAFCVAGIGFHENFGTAASQLRNRTGVLAVVNMIPLFIMAGRNNPLIKWLNISFDTFNLLHRWFGRIVILEALTHTLAFLIPIGTERSWSAAFGTAFRVPYMMFGAIATIAFLAIGIQAMSPIRHAFYETFKIIHILLAALAIAGLYYHLSLKHLPHIRFIYPIITIWVLDRLARFIRLLYANVGKGGTKTVIEALPGNACRVTVTMARPWTFKPGQHAYLYMPSISFWQSHPFSVAWSEEAEDLDSEKLALNRQEVLAMRKTSMSFVIRGRTGMTARLYKKAAEAKDGKLLTTCFVEGPYGGLHGLQSYGTVMLFAGGVGITQAVPHVRDLVVGYANGTVAARKVVLVWIIQSPEHLEWIRPWMTEILAMEKRREVLRIMLFVSRPRSTKEIHSPSATVQMFPGRPNIDTLIGIEMENQVGAMGISACGPGSLTDEVRRATRGRAYQKSINFVEEAFSW